MALPAETPRDEAGLVLPLFLDPKGRCRLRGSPGGHRRPQVRADVGPGLVVRAGAAGGTVHIIRLPVVLKLLLVADERGGGVRGEV